MASTSSKGLPLLRKAYTVAAENLKVQSTAASVSKNVSDASPKNEASGEEQVVFWMKDPRTGNWVPESHFNEVDVAELREKVLSNNKK